VSGGGAGACDETVGAEDAEGRALIRARCDHPDMLVHPNAWLLRRVAAPLNVVRFELVHDGVVDCAYDVARDGRARRAP